MIRPALSVPLAVAAFAVLILAASGRLSAQTTIDSRYPIHDHSPIWIRELPDTAQ